MVLGWLGLGLGLGLGLRSGLGLGLDDLALGAPSVGAAVARALA